MSGTSSLIQLWQIPSTKLSFARSKFSKVAGRYMVPALCFSRDMQTVTYEIVNGSYVPNDQNKPNKVKDKALGTQETVGAFQKLPVVMPSVDILYSSLRKARKVSATKGIPNAAKRERNKGAKQLDTLMKELAVPLRMYKENFPNRKQLHPYERSLVELTLGDGNYEKVLGHVDALRKKVTGVGKEHAALCAKSPLLTAESVDPRPPCQNPAVEAHLARYVVNGFAPGPSTSKREAEERLSEGMAKLEEIFIQEGKAVDNLLNIAKTLRAMPVVDLETPTLCLVGAPNVGKSTLVRILSTGKPEICNYPFTTRGILMGHIAFNYQNFQVTDTPGLLRRHDDDRNNLEKLTLAVLSHLPTAVLYVHDLSGECGTSPSDQFVIYKEIKERFSNHLWLDAVSKCDLLQESPVLYVTEDSDADHLELARYRKMGPDGAIHVSVNSETGLNEVSIL
ncbi:hypothetical protein RHSIM_Rhsim07G0039900 [Rhododendron simsii]|uniref:Nucleolar GTP-binding protein 1 n=1 Tax=Rhododendron simsii TaxID=118357 RepID=A0A834GRI4_RHOSS|nr:hypothetical protein RHSIM_Rhsim07G0039900 [Rhododendron simsii]